MHKRVSFFLGFLALSGCASEPEGEDTHWQVAARSSGVSIAPSPGGSVAVVSSVVPSTARACQSGIPVTSQLPLLTNLEYQNTVSDLFGVPLDVAGGLAPDSVGSPDVRSWDAYLRAAKRISADVMSRPVGDVKLLPCATEDEACAQQFIAQFGKRAFRRPLTPQEQTRYLRLFQERAKLTKDGTFPQAIELIVRAFIASPSFLVKGEFAATGNESQRIALNDWELAARLAYGLTASMPDAELFAAAEAGSLHTPEATLAQARRLLQTKHGREQVARFHRSYLQMDLGGRWTTDISRDQSVYPNFSPALVPAANTETSLFTDHVTYAMGSYQDLLTKPLGFVNKDLAAVYGLDPAAYGGDFVATELDPKRYAGMLTRAGFLMSHGSAKRTNPITRGAFIQKFVLCRTMAPPPNGAAATPLPEDGTLKTNRARVDAQTSETACSYCHHNLINPVGFALENFDSIGAYQVTDNGEAIDSSAKVLLGDNQVVVSGPVELMQQLAVSPEAHRCYAEGWFALAYGRRAGEADACMLQTASNRMADSKYSILNLVADMTQAEQFRYRAMGPAEVAP